MTNPQNDSRKDVPLNPELRERTDTTHDTEQRPAAPLETTGAHEGSQGEGWPVIWLVVTLASVALAIYYLV